MVNIASEMEFMVCAVTSYIVMGSMIRRSRQRRADALQRRCGYCKGKENNGTAECTGKRGCSSSNDRGSCCDSGNGDD